MAMDIFDELHRRDLADAVLRGHLIGFDYWLRFQAGAYYEGRWHPAGPLSYDRCGELIEMLTEDQLDECYWRGLIPPPNSDERAEITWSRSATIHPNPHGGYVILDPLWQQIIYGLRSGPRIRLRPGELELLKAAGLPGTWDGLLEVLWCHIGSRKHAPDSLGERLRQIGALLYSDATRDVVDLIAQLRALAPPPSALDGDIARVALAERHALECAFTAIMDEGWLDSDLATALRRLEAAQNALRRRTGTASTPSPTLAGQVRALSAVLHNTTLDPATRLALAQELVPPLRAAEGAIDQVVRVVQAERAVLDQARAASEDSWFNSELAAAVQELQAALTTNP